MTYSQKLHKRTINLHLYWSSYNYFLGWCHKKIRCFTNYINFNLHIFIYSSRVNHLISDSVQHSKFNTLDWCTVALYICRNSGVTTTRNVLCRTKSMQFSKSINAVEILWCAAQIPSCSGPATLAQLNSKSKCKFPSMPSYDHRSGRWTYSLDHICRVRLAKYKLYIMYDFSYWYRCNQPKPKFEKINHSFHLILQGLLKPPLSQN